VRHREIARHFELRVQTRIIGNSPIPERRLASAGGELVYNTEVNEPLYPEAPPQGVPMDVWRATINLVESESTNQDVTGTRADTAQGGTRPTLQVLELVRIPYTRVDYHYGDQDYAFYAYDGAGQEKFYADRYPARWDRIERLVRAISNDLITPSQQENAPPANPGSGYRVPIEFPPYTITEDDENI
jgi:hypothetical protein